MKKYFYFRTVADQDGDAAVANSVMLPVDSLVGIEPYNSSNGTSANMLILYFESLYNEFSGVANDWILRDTVKIEVTPGKSKQVIEAIGSAMAGGIHTDGIITVADDVTTTHETSIAGADETVAAKYLDRGIVACDAIAVAAQLS